MELNAHYASARRLALSVVMVVTLSTMATGSALASCSFNRGVDHFTAHRVIAVQTVSGVTKVKSTISEYDPVYTAANTTGTNSTVLLSNSTSTWAQFGWFKSQIITPGVTARNSIAQMCNNCGGHPVNNWWPAQPIGNQTIYEVDYGATGFGFYRNGQLLITVGPSFVPSNYQIFSETHDLQDQMPGGTVLNEFFRFSQYFSAGGWHNATPIGTTEPYYGYNNPLGGGYDVWDKSCT
jgi:hypothetical protein